MPSPIQRLSVALCLTFVGIWPRPLLAQGYFELLLPEDVDRSAATRRGQLHWTRGRVLGIVPGLDTLDTVKAALGPASESKFAEQRVTLVCYRARARDDDTTIAFQTSTADPGRVVQAIVVAHEDIRGAAASSCAKSRGVSRDTAAVGQLRLGAELGQVKAALKDIPTLDAPDSLRYQYSMPAARRPGCEVYSGLITRIAEGRVTWFMSYRETFCVRR